MGYRKSSSSSGYAQKRVHSVVAAKLKAHKTAKARQHFFGEKKVIQEPKAHVAQGLSVPANPGKLLSDFRGLFAVFPSKSNPSTHHETRIWKIAQGQFKPGDVSCNCNGWKFNKKCHHTADMVRDYRAANPSDPTIFTSHGIQL